jgi:lipid-binding SYLF domain-containing protein
MLKKVFAILPLLILPMQIAPCKAATDEPKLDKDDVARLDAATQVLEEMMNAGDKGIPANLFAGAHCVVVIPNMVKAGFIFSGKFGRGFASCRRPNGTGWTGPAAMRAEGGGFGLQAGGSAVDIIMLVMSQRGMQGLLATRFTLGGEASVAAGPVGRQATAQTDPSMRADILSWSRSRGIFGGLSLQGGTLRGDGDVNKALYGHDVSDAEILTGKVKSPAVASKFLATVRKFGGLREQQ